MRRMILLVSAVVVAVVLVSAASGSAGRARWAVTVLGVAGRDLNDRGQVVGDAFLWENGKVRDLGSLGKGNTFATAINERGQVVGTSGQRAFLWENGKMRDLGALASGGGPVAINDRGQVVGQDPGGYSKESRVVLWDRGRMQVIARPRRGGYGWVEALAINAQGMVLVASLEGHAPRALLWRNGKLVHLGIDVNELLLSRSEFGLGAQLNDRGQVVGERRTKDGMVLPVMWENGRLHDLGGILAGANGGADSINERGQVVGWAFWPRRAGSSVAPHVFLWQNGKMRDLGRPHGEGFGPAIINDRGQIITTLYYGGDSHGFAQSSRAYVWHDGAWIALPPLAGRWTGTTAYRINNSGQILGSSGGHTVLWTLRHGT
jgi:probable HAF family extracellular repeat protein